MSTAGLTRLMTVEELLTLPDDGIDRELINGELRERPMTRSNKWHGSSEIRIGRFLDLWLEDQPVKGVVVGGETGFILSRSPDTSIAIDVACVSPEVLASTPDSASFIEGIPVLAVEILSPWDTQEDIKDKLTIHQNANVPVVWFVNTDFRSVLVLRKGEKPRMYTEGENISGDPELPGLVIPVTKIFPL